MPLSLAQMRRNYCRDGLADEAAPDDPLPLFRQWLQQARDTEQAPVEANSMCLATVDAEDPDVTPLHGDQAVFHQPVEDAREGLRLDAQLGGHQALGHLQHTSPLCGSRSCNRKLTTRRLALPRGRVSMSLRRWCRCTLMFAANIVLGVGHSEQQHLAAVVHPDGRPRPGGRVRSGRRCYWLAPIQVVRRLNLPRCSSRCREQALKGAHCPFIGMSEMLKKSTFWLCYGEVE